MSDIKPATDEQIKQWKKDEANRLMNDPSWMEMSRQLQLIARIEQDRELYKQLDKANDQGAMWAVFYSEKNRKGRR